MSLIGPDLNLIEHLWRDLNMTLHQHSPFSLVELERFCKEEQEKLPRNRWPSLEHHTERRAAVIAAKGASTKY